MWKILILGAGRVGRVIARDLHEDPAVELTVADARDEWLRSLARRHGFATVTADLSDPSRVRDLASSHDLVVGALPGHMGLATMEAVIDAATSMVDISFLPEDPRHLDARAREKGAVVLYDMGVAPGMSNVLLAAGVEELAPATSARYLVGGLPVVRRLPWEYEAPFSPIDVLEEYTRPARFLSGGSPCVRPALSDLELFHFPGLGTLEGFLTDGLRSLLDTVDCPNIEEKTLRYPGHSERIRLLLDSGFLDDREISVGGKTVNVRDFTFALLDPAWQQADPPHELTVMRVEVSGSLAEGSRTGEPRRLAWDLLDRTDRASGETSMARTTGFPAAICARHILSGSAPLSPGVHPPEELARSTSFVETLLAELADRGVSYEKSYPGRPC